MNDQQKFALHKCMSDLCESMDVDGVLIDLAASTAITKEFYERISAVQERKTRSYTLLTELPNQYSKVGTTWENLLSALDKVHQKHLADKLRAAFKETANLPKSKITQDQRQKILAEALQKKKHEIRFMLVTDIKVNCENVKKAWQEFLPQYKLCEIFQPLQMLKTKGTRVGEKTVDSVIEYLLEDENRLLLIEGDSGVGKTTYVNKLALDWAEGNAELNSAFDFVFLINLEHYIFDNFMDIFQSILGDSYSFARLSLLESNRTLLIVDAYDDRELKYFDQILQGILIEEKTTVRAKILVTTKGAYVDRVASPDAWFKINGFDADAALKLFELQGVPNVDVKEIAEMFEVITEIVQIPLFATMLCFTGITPTDLLQMEPQCILCEIFESFFDYHKQNYCHEILPEKVQEYENAFDLAGEFAFTWLSNIHESVRNLLNVNIPTKPYTDCQKIGLISAHKTRGRKGYSTSLRFHHQIFAEYFVSLWISKHFAEQINKMTFARARKLPHHLLYFLASKLPKLAFWSNVNAQPDSSVTSAIGIDNAIFCSNFSTRNTDAGKMEVYLGKPPLNILVLIYWLINEETDLNKLFVSRWCKMHKSTLRLRRAANLMENNFIGALKLFESSITQPGLVSLSSLPNLYALDFEKCKLIERFTCPIEERKVYPALWSLQIIKCCDALVNAVCNMVESRKKRLKSVSIDDSNVSNLTEFLIQVGAEQVQVVDVCIDRTESVPDMAVQVRSLHMARVDGEVATLLQHCSNLEALCLQEFEKQNLLANIKLPNLSSLNMSHCFINAKAFATAPLSIVALVSLEITERDLLALLAKPTMQSLKLLNVALIDVAEENQIIVNYLKRLKIFGSTTVGLFQNVIRTATLTHFSLGTADISLLTSTLNVMQKNSVDKLTILFKVADLDSIRRAVAQLSNLKLLKLEPIESGIAKVELETICTLAQEQLRISNDAVTVRFHVPAANASNEVEFRKSFRCTEIEYFTKQALKWQTMETVKEEALSKIKVVRIKAGCMT